MEKRYYWLKFRDDFFDSKRIKKLRKLAGGDTYTIIYLKMQLKALKTDGVLKFTGVEKDFPDELALDLDENPDDVRMTLSYLMTYGMCECSDNIHYFLPYVAENTGSETATAQRMREFRVRLKLSERNNVTGLLQPRYGEIEKEIEIDNTPKGVYRRFTPPSIEEVRAYVQEKGLKVNADDFFTYFTTPNNKGETWVDSKGNKVKNWKQKLLTWENMDRNRSKSRNTLNNYKETGVSHPETSAIAFSEDDL